jgi:hypothetical protein
MPMSDTSRKRALECLRFEADCKELAARTNRSELKGHFARMANIWADTAAKEPVTSDNEI